MSYFKINITSIKEKPNKIDGIANQYDTCIASLDGIITKVSYSSTYQDIVRALNRLVSEAEQSEKMLYGVAVALEEIVNQYERVEKKAFKGNRRQEGEQTVGDEESGKSGDFLKSLMGFMNNGGSLVSGVTVGISTGVVVWLRKYIGKGFDIKWEGKYIKVIFGSNAIKKQLGFRHKYKISDIGKVRELDELLKLDKDIKTGKFAEKLSGVGNALAVIGIGLDVLGGIWENYNKDADWHEYVGDAAGDVAVGAGGFAVASAATEAGAYAGAAAGAAIGSVFPGPGTAVGGIIGGIAGGIGGAVGSSLLYNEIVSDDFFGLLPEGESIEQYLKDYYNWVGEKAEEGIGWVGDKAGELWDGIGDAIDNFSFGW